MRGVIMAGGRGTRLRPITYSIPKPLVPIAGKPCINYVLDSFHRAGVDSSIITTGYKFESLIKGVLENQIQKERTLFSVEMEPAGTAGSVKRAAEFMGDTFLVGSGDILSDFELKDLVAFHKKNGFKISLALTTVEDPSQLGIVETSNGRVVRFLEKPSKGETFSNLANAGIYVVEKEIMDYVPDDKPYDFAREFFPKLLEMGIPIGGLEVQGTWVDTGRPPDLIKANQVMTEKHGKVVKPHAGKMMIGEDVKFEGNVTLHGPTYIGARSKLMDGAKVTKSAIYNSSVIGVNAEVIDSVLMYDTAVGESSVIESSVIMQGTTVGKNCEIRKSVLPSGIKIEDNSRIYNVSLSPMISEEENTQY